MAMKIKRHFNYTGRRHIEKERVEIWLQNTDSNMSFKTSINLSGLMLPPQAPVIVEARQNPYLIQRFHFGTVDKIVEPADTSLSELGHEKSIQFRIKIIDPKNKFLILADSGLIRAKNDPSGDSGQQHENLLVLSLEDLGDEIWKLKFHPDAKPELVVNNQIPDAKNRIKEDPFFKALILPAAVREVLTYIIIQDLDSEAEEEEDNWLGLWIRFGEQIFGEKLPDTDPEDKLEWVDDVVKKFCEKYKWCKKLIESLMGEPVT